tara:strand:- start:480 stop:1079 length:600 start_codon:yes stop_codon:yes gene_type:complete
MNITYSKCKNNKGTTIEDLLLLEPKINQDNRGFFYESWNKRDFNKILIENNQQEQLFFQDNHSSSINRTLRGLHYQKEPYAQGKLVRCVKGKIFDVAVDLRKDSKTFLEYSAVIISSENHYQFWIPKGFAHGFLTLSDNTEVLYKTTNYWDGKSEVTLKWDDPKININWPDKFIKGSLNISEKDSKALYFDQIKDEEFF